MLSIHIADSNCYRSIRYRFGGDMGPDEAKKLLTPEACRAGRALLGWSMNRLVAEARVSPNTVTKLERGDSGVRPETALRIVQAFAAQNVEITNGDGTGARLRTGPRAP